jgi:hypothetical protein
VAEDGYGVSSSVEPMKMNNVAIRAADTPSRT